MGLPAPFTLERARLAARLRRLLADAEPHACDDLAALLGIRAVPELVVVLRGYGVTIVAEPGPTYRLAP